MREYLNHYGGVATHLEGMSDYVKRLHKAMTDAQAESKETYATMREMQKARELLHTEIHRLEKELSRVVGFLDRSVEAICGKCNVDCDQATEFERESCWGKTLRDIIEKAGYKNGD